MAYTVHVHAAAVSQCFTTMPKDDLMFHWRTYVYYWYVV